MSRYSTSAKKDGSTHVAFGFLIGRVSFDFGLTTVSSCFRIWLDTVRDQPLPTLPIYRSFLPSFFSQIKGRDAGRILHEADDRKLSLLDALYLQPAFIAVRTVWRLGILGNDTLNPNLQEAANISLPSVSMCSL